MARKNSAVEVLPRDRKAEFQRQVAQMIEEQVTEALSHQSDRIFQPFFQTREIAHEIKRRQTVTEQRKFIYAYAKYGCLSCGTKERPHESLWMCARCRSLRYQQLLDVIRENERPEEPTLRFMDTVRMARESLLAPAIPAVAEPKAFAPPTTEGYYLTAKQVAEAAGVKRGTLATWIFNGVFQPPKRKPSDNRPMWTQEDVQRLREFAARQREPRPAKPRPPRPPRPPRMGGGRPKKVLDRSAIAALRAQGKPWREIAVILGCSPMTLYRVAAQMKTEKPE